MRQEREHVKKHDNFNAGSEPDFTGNTICFRQNKGNPSLCELGFPLIQKKEELIHSVEDSFK
jgi:hypothetical protein